MGMRYQNRFIRINAEPLYETFFRDRGVPYINQYGTPEMRYPTSEEISKLELIGHIWKMGDRYYKLAHQYYGDPKLWWIIAWFNQKPTEGFLSLGQLIHIPLPLEKILRYHSL